MPYTYVKGGVYTNTLVPVRGAVIQLVSLRTRSVLSKAETLVSEFYEAWTNLDPATVGVKFLKAGYASKVIPINDLVQKGDVYLVPGSSPSAALAPALLIAAALAIGNKKNRSAKVGKLDKSDIQIAFLVAGGVVAFSLVRKVLDKLGLGPDPVKPVEADPNSAWKPSYWRQFSNYSYTITESSARTFAQTVYNSFGLFKDDYAAVLNVFSQMRTKANVSFLSYVFSNEYNTDLLSFLSDGGGILPWDGLSSDHLKTLISYVDKLPKN